MNINETFTSNYIKASDLQGRRVQVRVRDVRNEVVGEQSKIVLYFQGKDKGFICNRTNCLTIAEAWGPETDNWIGGALEMFSMKVPYQGKLVDGLRVRPLQARQQKPASPPQGSPRVAPNARDDWQEPPSQPAPAMAGGDDPFDDSEVPF